MDDWRTAPVSPRVRAVLEFLTVFVPPHQTFGADDIAKLRDAGLSTAAIRDAMYASWCFQNLSRWMDAFGFPPHTPRLKRLAARGIWMASYSAIRVD